MFLEILKKIYEFFFDTIQTILLVGSFCLVIYLFIMRPFEVSGDSMFPTFHNGEYVLTNLISLRFEELKRGDVIVFRAPVDREKDFIKRIIAVGGDVIEVRDGFVYVNGSILDESAYLSSDVRTQGGSFLRNGQKITVPQGMLIVMGDNRAQSLDSREWGFLKKEDVIGKSFFVYWPPQKARMVKNPFKND
jgi:signal peptidase I